MLKQLGLFEEAEEMQFPQINRFKTPYNELRNQKDAEVNNQPSMTVPDQTMSIQEILHRYRRGLPIEGQKVPMYEGEENDLPDLRNLDLAERQEIAETIEKELEEMNQRINAPKPTPEPSQPDNPPAPSAGGDPA